MTDTNTTPVPPRFKHDCDACKYLGRYGEFDLYFCASTNSLTARYGSKRLQRACRGEITDPELIAEAKRRIAAGLLPAEPSDTITAPDTAATIAHLRGLLNQAVGLYALGIGSMTNWDSPNSKRCQSDATKLIARIYEATGDEK